MKVMETIVRDEIMLRSGHFIDNRQHGFCSSKPWNRMMINHSTLEYHVTNFNTFFRRLWRKNQNPNTLL